MKKFSRIISIIGLAIIMSACGSGDAPYKYASESSVESYSDEGMYSDYDVAEVSLNEDMEGSGSTEPVQVDEEAVDNRKLIKTVNINVETTDFDVVYSSIEKKVKELGGYISNSSIWSKSDGLKNGSLTIRIPAEKTDSIIAAVEEGSNVKSKNESVEDVTMHYADLESHKKALLTEQDSLLRLMETAETTSDIIEIQNSLTEVRYQIESMESQLRLLSNQISYSTIDLSIEEVTKPSASSEETVWEMIARRFNNKMRDVIEFMTDFIIGVIVNIPVFIALLIVIIIVVFILKIFVKVLNFIFKRNKNRKEKKEKNNDEHERHDEGDISMESVQRKSP